MAKGYLVGSYLLGLEDPGSRMARLGAQLTCLGEVRRVDEQVADYEAVDQGRRAPAVIDRVLCQPRVARRRRAGHEEGAHPPASGLSGSERGPPGPSAAAGSIAGASLRAGLRERR